MLMMLSFDEFKNMVGYSYSELNIKLSTPKGDYEDGSFRQIVIQNKEELKMIFDKVNELSFEKGFEESELRNIEIKDDLHNFEGN